MCSVNVGDAIICTGCSKDLHRIWLRGEVRLNAELGLGAVQKAPELQVPKAHQPAGVQTALKTEDLGSLSAHAVRAEQPEFLGTEEHEEDQGSLLGKMF